MWFPRDGINMFKPTLIALSCHVLILTVVWVGFPAPLPRNEVDFFYNGSAMPLDAMARHNMPFIFEAQEGAMFAPWIKDRDLDKPKRR